MSDRDLCYSELMEVSRRVQNKELSPVDVTKAVLDRIAAVDKSLHSYALGAERSGAAAGQDRRGGDRQGQHQRSAARRADRGQGQLLHQGHRHYQRHGDPPRREAGL